MVPGFTPEPAFTAAIDRIVEESGLLAVETDSSG
jgi:hypothetical protein